MNNKSFTTDFKADETGKGRAVFATFDQVDKDGDVTLPGAFGNQSCKVCAAHQWELPPIGAAKVSESGSDAIADFQLNMEMTAAQEWYKSMKFNSENGLVQEFSYGFHIDKESFGEREGKQVRILEKLSVFEISPVLLGAGMNTRLLAMKSDESCRLEDHFETVEKAYAELIERVEGLAALRREKGKDLGDVNKSRLQELLDRKNSLTERVQALLAGDTDDLEDLVLVELEAELALGHQIR